MKSFLVTLLRSWADRLDGRLTVADLHKPLSYEAQDYIAARYTTLST